MKSFFYIDESEFNSICNQIADNVSKISTKKTKSGNIECDIETGSIFKKIVPELKIDGILQGTEEKYIDQTITIEEKIEMTVNEVEKLGNAITDHTKTIRDGEIVIIEGEFALNKIIVEEDEITDFDKIENLDYILGRLPEQSVLVFECNSLAIHNPISTIPVFQMKMQYKKVKKGIHHYSSKIFEYANFTFKVLGEINICTTKVLINPIVVWR